MIGDSGEHGVAVLSIDDFYLTRAERRELAHSVHPLLATRGVPGTHDIAMLRECLARLRVLRRGERCRLPRFDKATDERAASSSWPAVTGPIDLVILEGWCVGSVAETDADLDAPVNELEADKDPDGRWRRYVNDCLKTDYAELFAELDALVFLQAPGFEAILRWRVEQEHKLTDTVGEHGPAVMSDNDVREFVRHFERITRNNQSTVRSNADVVLELDEYHDCVASHYRE
jgi:D-glycerate 3-kinase